LRKKKVLIQTDFAVVKSGFGRNAKAILTYLYKTDKYELVNYCVGIVENYYELQKTPWKSIGCIPTDKEKSELIEKDPKLKYLTPYGAFKLDEVIEKERPDVYISAQDIWGVDFATQRSWFDKITSAIWTTLDSLPILPAAIKAANKCENFWVWSNFAQKEMQKMGIKNVKTLHGALEEKDFYRLTDSERQSLRSKNNIGKDEFVVGFVFRNQLRKSVPNLIKGFKQFKSDNPSSKAKLLLHTHLKEGWNIRQLIEESNINPNDVLFTYICEECSSYEVRPFINSDCECKSCGEKNSLETVSVGKGVTESQLNEVYNLMDVYCHPFTSGGQEIPIQEAKLTELITLVTNYSCGEEMCEPEANSLALEWDEYREIGTNFKKANTRHESISKKLEEVYKMSPASRKEMGEKAREWTIENFSISRIGLALESFIDNAPLIDEKNYPTPEKKDPNAEVEFNENGATWVKNLYRDILKVKVDDDDEGLVHWLKKLKEGMPPAGVEQYFRQVAAKENIKEAGFNQFLSKDDEGRRILFVFPQNLSEAVLATSLLKSAKETYPNHNIYVSTEQPFGDFFAPNELIHKILPPYERAEGYIDNLEKQDFEIVFDLNTYDYKHNQKDEISFALKS